MEDNISDFLKKWVSNFIKNKDIISGTIQKIDIREKKIYVSHKNKKQLFMIEPFLKNISTIKKDINEAEDFVCIATYNTKENLDFMINNWKDLIKSQKLSIYFINPMSKTEKKWIIFPHTHDSISEKSSLRQGLLSLFNTVDVLTEEEIKKIFS